MDVVDVAELDGDVTGGTQDVAHRVGGVDVDHVGLAADADGPVAAGDLQAAERDVLGAAHVDDVVLEVLVVVVERAEGVAGDDGGLAVGGADEDRLGGGADVGDVEHVVVGCDVGPAGQDDLVAGLEPFAANDGVPVVGGGEVVDGSGRRGRADRQTAAVSARTRAFIQALPPTGQRASYHDAGSLHEENRLEMQTRSGKSSLRLPSNRRRAPVNYSDSR